MIAVAIKTPSILNIILSINAGRMLRISSFIVINFNGTGGDMSLTAERREAEDLMWIPK